MSCVTWLVKECGEERQRGQYKAHQGEDGLLDGVAYLARPAGGWPVPVVQPGAAPQHRHPQLQQGEERQPRVHYGRFTTVGFADTRLALIYALAPSYGQNFRSPA